MTFCATGLGDVEIVRVPAFKVIKLKVTAEDGVSVMDVPVFDPVDVQSDEGVVDA